MKPRGKWATLPTMNTIRESSESKGPHMSGPLPPPMRTDDVLLRLKIEDLSRVVTPKELAEKVRASTRQVYRWLAGDVPRTRVYREGITELHRVLVAA